MTIRITETQMGGDIIRQLYTGDAVNPTLVASLDPKYVDVAVVWPGSAPGEDRLDKIKSLIASWGKHVTVDSQRVVYPVRVEFLPGSDEFASKDFSSFEDFLQGAVEFIKTGCEGSSYFRVLFVSNPKKDSSLTFEMLFENNELIELASATYGQFDVEALTSLISDTHKEGTAVQPVLREAFSAPHNFLRIPVAP